MPKTEQEQLGALVERMGFTRECDTLYVRCAEDELKQCVRLSFNRKKRVCLDVFLELQHKKISLTVGSLLKRAYPQNSDVIEAPPLDVVPLYEVALSATERTVATAFYDYQDADEFSKVLQRLEKDLTVAIPKYFGALGSLGDVVTFFKSTPNSGGAAHDILLLTLAYFAGDVVTSSRLAEEYRSSQFSEMTRTYAKLFRLEYLKQVRT